MKKSALMLHLESYNVLETKDVEALVSIAETRHLNKGDFFIREDERCEDLAFVHSGFLHAYYSSKSLDHITYCIVFPNEFVTALSSYISNQKSRISIQALTDIEIEVLSKQQLNELVNSNHNIQRFFSTIIESYLLKLENRFFQFQKDDAKNRYEELLKNHPGFIQNIPLKLLASYLGVTPRHLSRIRASKN